MNIIVLKLHEIFAPNLYVIWFLDTYELDDSGNIITIVVAL